jgi:hypothetical protein
VRERVKLQPGLSVWSGRAGGTDCPSQYKSHLPGHSFPAKLGRMPCTLGPDLHDNAISLFHANTQPYQSSQPPSFTKYAAFKGTVA